MAETDGFSVKLHVYDLTKGLARSMSMPFLGKQIDGVWHTGIVVYGEEYYFGGTAGIEMCHPCGTQLGRPDDIVDMGITHVPKDMFIEYIVQLSTTSFSATKYNLFEHNCNNFSDEISQFLTGKRIPSHITSLPAEVLNTPLGAMIKPLIDSMNVQPSGGHSVIPSNHPAPVQPASQSTSHVTSTNTLINQSASHKSSDVLQKPVILQAEIDNSCMKGDEIQGNIKSTFSVVELNLWNETLEYLQTSKPSWSLSRNHVQLIGNILCSKPSDIKLIVWKSTCLILQNLLLLDDFYPVLIHSSLQILQQILSQYTNLTPENRECLIQMVINLCSNKSGCDILFGDKRDVKLSESCVEICCDGLLDYQNENFLLSAARLALNISLALTDDDSEIQIASAIISSLKQSLTESIAINLLSALINIIHKNDQVKALVTVMGCDWDNLETFSDQIKGLYSTVKTLCTT